MREFVGNRVFCGLGLTPDAAEQTMVSRFLLLMVLINLFLVIGRRDVLFVVLLRTPVERRRVERVVFRRIEYRVFLLRKRGILAGKRGWWLTQL